MSPVPNSTPTTRSKRARRHPYSQIDARGSLAREAVSNIADSLRHYSNEDTRSPASLGQAYNGSPLELCPPTRLHLTDENNALGQSVPFDPRIVLSNAIASADTRRADNDQHSDMNQELSPANPGPSSATLDSAKYSADDFMHSYGGGPSYQPYFPFNFANVQPFNAAVYNHPAPPQSPSPGLSLSAGLSGINHPLSYHLGNNLIASQPAQHHHHHPHSPQFALPPPQQNPASMFMQQTAHQAEGAAPPAQHPCGWQDGSGTCPGWVPGKSRDMQHHLRSYHDFVGNEREEVPCRWDGCTSILQRQNMGRHVVAVHLRAGARCGRCYRRFCRPDVASRHERQCNAAAPIHPPPSLSDG